MKKDYYNEQKANYINKRLRSTGINKVYLPLVTDVMLRRQFEYGLSDEMLDRDINNFIDNVAKIEVDELEPGTGGEFDIIDKKITLNQQLFQMGPMYFEAIYETLAHECTHAMNIVQMENGEKEDRIFNHNNFTFFIGAEEVFTECEADAQVYNKRYSESDKRPYISETAGYSKITPYIDVISSTFGVSKKDLLSASVKGEEELNNLLNKSLNTTYENLGDNEIFYAIVTNLSLLHSAMEKEEQSNISETQQRIYKFAMSGVNERFSDIEINDIDNFKQKFDRTKLEAAIINITTKEVERDENKVNDVFYNKLRCIDKVLGNENIEKNIELLRNIQSLNSMDELQQLMEENNITLDSDMRLSRPSETIKEYNMEYCSRGNEWDNIDIISYIGKNKERMINSKNNILKRISTKFKSWIVKLGRTDDKEIKLLTGGTELENIEPKSWELSNWGIDKEQFMQQYHDSIEEQSSMEEPKQQENVVENQSEYKDEHER